MGKTTSYHIYLTVLFKDSSYQQHSYKWTYQEVRSTLLLNSQPEAMTGPLHSFAKVQLDYHGILWYFNVTLWNKTNTYVLLCWTLHIGPARGHSLKFQTHVRIKNLNSRLKILSIGHFKLSHSISLQILPILT